MTAPPPTRASLQNLPDLQGLDLFGPADLAAAAPILDLLIESPEPPLDYVLVGGIPVVSHAFRRALAGAGVRAEVDWYPAIWRRGRAPMGGQPYHFMHLRRVVDCLDFEASVFDWAGQPPRRHIENLRRLALHDDRAAATPIFRVAGAEHLVALSDGVARALAGLSGLACVTPGDWRPGA